MSTKSRIVCPVCHDCRAGRCTFCKVEPNSERRTFLFELWIKLKTFNQPSTGSYKLDIEIKKAFGFWLSGDKAKEVHNGLVRLAHRTQSESDKSILNNFEIFAKDYIHESCI